MDALDGDAVSRLDPYTRPPVLGGGEPVGKIVPVFELTWKT
jgi:hypothetical protein